MQDQGCVPRPKRAQAGRETQESLASIGPGEVVGTVVLGVADGSLDEAQRHGILAAVAQEEDLVARLGRHGDDGAEAFAGHERKGLDIV